MKHLFFAAIVILTACNRVQPVETVDDGLCVDNWDSAYEAGWKDERRAQEADTIEPVEYAQADWQFIAETCEEKLLGERLECDVEKDQYDGLHKVATSYRDALRCFDLTEQCDDGLIDETICKVFFNGNL